MGVPKEFLNRSSTQPACEEFAARSCSEVDGPRADPELVYPILEQRIGKACSREIMEKYELPDGRIALLELQLALSFLCKAGLQEKVRYGHTEHLIKSKGALEMYVLSIRISQKVFVTMYSRHTPNATEYRAPLLRARDSVRELWR